MSRNKILLLISFSGFILLSSLVFIPRSYDVLSFEVRKGTQNWQLETGSKIGYTKVKGKGLVTNNPIIFLHGGPGGMIKDKFIETLKPLSELGHDLYFYDQIGSGHSERLEDIKEYSVSRHKEDLREIILKTGFDKVILIGHSWGAMLAINYLQDYDESIEKIILAGPGPILPINKGTFKEIAPDSLSLTEPEYSNNEGNKKANNWRSKLMSKWAYIFNSKLASDSEADDFYTFLNQELNKSTNCKGNESKVYKGGGGYYSQIMTVKSFKEVEDKRKKLKELKTPILIMRGQCDNQKWGFTKEYLDLFDNSKLEMIENVGHDLINGNREKYYELVSAFCE